MIYRWLLSEGVPGSDAAKAGKLAKYVDTISELTKGAKAADQAKDVKKTVKAIDTAKDTSKASKTKVVSEYVDHTKGSNQKLLTGPDPKALRLEAPKTKPNQVHHYATNKNKTYTPEMENIAKNYGLDLDGDWNKELLPHQGRHPNEYHDMVTEAMRQADTIAQGNTNLFLEIFDKTIKDKVRHNPDVIYKDYWRNLRK